MFCSCLYSNLEYRRCLSLLEQTGHLSASSLSTLSELICPNNNNNNNNTGPGSDPDRQTPSSSVSSSFKNPQHVQQVAVPAVLLAAQCMLALERYEDCLGLLEGQVATEEGTLATLAVSSSRQLHVRASVETNTLGLNPIAGMKY